MAIIYKANLIAGAVDDTIARQLVEVIADNTVLLRQEYPLTTTESAKFTIEEGVRVTINRYYVNQYGSLSVPGVFVFVAKPMPKPEAATVSEMAA